MFEYYWTSSLTCPFLHPQWKDHYSCSFHILNDTPQWAYFSRLKVRHARGARYDRPSACRLGVGSQNIQMSNSILASISTKILAVTTKPELAKMFIVPNSFSHRRRCVDKPKITRMPMDHCYRTLHSVDKDNALWWRCFGDVYSPRSAEPLMSSFALCGCCGVRERDSQSSESTKVVPWTGTLRLKSFLISRY